MSVDISGIDKVELLKALWENMPIASFFSKMPFMAPRFDETEAREALETYIDYFCGRCIKTDLSGNSARPGSYDRDAGEGAFQSIVDSLRK